MPARFSRPPVPEPAAWSWYGWIWSGQPTGNPPLQLSQARAQAELAAMLTPLALGLVLLGAGLLVHVTLGRRRLAAWDADWQVTEPHWTKGR